MIYWPMTSAVSVTNLGLGSTVGFQRTTSALVSLPEREFFSDNLIRQVTLYIGECWASNTQRLAEVTFCFSVKPPDQ